MNLLLLMASVALGSVLAWTCAAWLQRLRQRTRSLRCIVAYVPAAQRTPAPQAKP